MPSLNSLKTLLLRRFVLVTVVTLVGTTALLQLPRAWTLRKLWVEVRQYRTQAMELRAHAPTPEAVAQWERAVPDTALGEPPRFVVNLRQLAAHADCRVSSTGDNSPVAVEGADSLASIDTAIKVTGSYAGLLDFFKSLRAEPRVVAISRATVTADHYPTLQAELTVRRYVRRSVAETTVSAVP